MQMKQADFLTMTISEWQRKLNGWYELQDLQELRFRKLANLFVSTQLTKKDQRSFKIEEYWRLPLLDDMQLYYSKQRPKRVMTDFDFKEFERWDKIEKWENLTDADIRKFGIGNDRI